MLRGIVARLRSQAGFLACLAPLGIGVLLNGVLRPWWAAELGGRRRTWSSTRGNNNWYEFPSEVREQHPLLTGFLSLQDGQVALAALVLVVFLFAARAVVRRMRSRAEKIRTGRA